MIPFIFLIEYTVKSVDIYRQILKKYIFFYENWDILFKI